MDDRQFSPLFEKTFPFWSQLGKADKEALLRSSHQVRFKKGASIHDGNDCTGVILIRSGALRMYLPSEGNREVTLSRLFAGDICILSASCVLKSITFDVLVEAEEESDCIIIDGGAYEEIARRVTEVKLFTYETALSRFSDVMWVMQQILFMSMEKRLAIFLLDETAKTGSDTVRLTHEQIAKYIGSAREVVSRMLKHFASEGLILSSRSEGIRIPDKKRLRELTL